MLGRFYLTQEAIDFLESCTAQALCKSGAGSELEKLRAVMGYLRCVLLHAPFGETLAAAPRWTTPYDVEGWFSEGCVRDLECHRFPELQTFTTTVEPARKALIESRIATFGEHPAGLGKFTRTVFARDLRRTAVCVRRQPGNTAGTYL